MVPVEVKSGDRSLHSYIDRYAPSRAIKLVGGTGARVPGQWKRGRCVRRSVLEGAVNLRTTCQRCALRDVCSSPLDAWTDKTYIHLLFVRLGDAKCEQSYCRQVRTILAILNAAPVTGAVLQEVANSNVNDFKDAVVAALARQVQVDAIATRNERDFAKASVSTYSPAALLVLLDASAKQSDKQ